MASEAVSIDKSETSDRANTKGKDCTVGAFITPEDGWKIIKVAETWEGTPYSLVGNASTKGVGGDCSGSTNKIFVEAGFPYPYQMTSSFAEYARKSNRFREIDRTKVEMQAGDVLLWPGHMAIYAPFPDGHKKRDTGVMKHGQKKYNNMYTAFNSRTNTPYGPYNIETFRNDPYKVFRYFVMPCVENNKK
jgi:hypothetical protein